MDAISKRRLWFVTALMAASLVPSLAPGQQQEHEWVGGRWTEAAEPAKGSPAGELALIRQAQQAGHRRTTVKAVKRFLKSYPGDKRCEEAMLLAGEAELQDDRHWKAYKWFSRVVQEYPSGQYFERVMNRQFEIAEVYLGGKKRLAMGFVRISAYNDGVAMLLAITEASPTSELAQQALIRAADFRFDRDEYVEAVELYSEYLELHPKAPQAAHAMVRCARANWAHYRGPEYDDTPLIEARQRFIMYAQQFPAEAEKINVPEILGQIANARAEKVYHTGAFYERVGKPVSAALYYNKVLAEYGDASRAADASGRLEQLGETIAKDGQ